MEFDIQSCAFNRKTGEQSGMGRTERINTSENELFNGVKTILRVKKIYESFWNDMNHLSEDVVFVSKVTPIK